MTRQRLIDILASRTHNRAEKCAHLHQAYLSGVIDTAERDALWYEYVSLYASEPGRRTDNMDSDRTS